MTNVSTADDAGESQAVVQLAPGCTREDVTEGERYVARVNGVVDYGIFVDLSENVSGLVHESTLSRQYEVGDELVVELAEIRQNGDLSFEPADIEPENVVERAPSYDRTATAVLRQNVGQTVHLEGEVVQVKQTGGPTIFRVRDETAIVPCTAFEGAGVRAHAAVEVGDVVHVRGVVETREDSVQVEVDDIERLNDDRERSVRNRLEAAVAERAEPPELDPLVDWPALEQMLPELRRVARRLRRTVLESRPIRIRHHADGDGMCAAVPVQLALERLIEKTHAEPSAKRHQLKRLPSKAPYYEMEDATRDLNYSLGDRDRHGQKLPLLLMLDNGSTEEDRPAYRTLDHYDIPIIVLDHHHPDPEAVEPFVEEHVNPYLHGEDYRITAGMLSVELARMIDPTLTDELRHVPAVAGLSDRSKADAMDDYLALAKEAGHSRDSLEEIGEALDYEAYMLRYDAGRTLIYDVLGIDDVDEARHRDLVTFLDDRAGDAVDAQLDDAMSHVDHERIANGAHLYRLDLDAHAHRFTYPAPGKTTGEIHDRKVTETREPVISIGYGPDFAVLRSDGVRLDIPQMVSDLNDELPGAGVSGGGHLVVGSIRFVPGMREAVLDALVEKMADAEIDEALSSTLDR
ncbi:DHH family phosphoesterase [Halanaeroarchaeum sulfurireducens]|uniref:Phosphoesterase RecJ domain protein n=1 Tax=Halanaeroarchaeum sulfurireducens TaxID=1604004 RepID=A0A0F7PBY4_9EURY|nr:OB-fold nucleic acid binding domain-containing protein [Halanaeroarchaeum sulfurireducens]AKH97650.1 phosphoesterase RecJ domain protein [Halanaeroarchaeum sulfurireducens]ALG82045.1 phosphoesterase RecJ domain protein [Halanaeroarchaeum sulfurireducens]